MKKTLNEQVFLIKQMMGKLNEGEIYKSSSEEHDDYLNELKTVEGTIKYLTRVSEKVEYIAEDLRNYYKGTEFWHYIKPLYSGLKSVSDLQRMHTRTDQREENISYAIEFIKSGFGEDDEEQQDMPGFEGTQDNLDALTIREQQTMTAPIVQKSNNGPKAPITCPPGYSLWTNGPNEFFCFIDNPKDGRGQPQGGAKRVEVPPVK